MAWRRSWLGSTGRPTVAVKFRELEHFRALLMKPSGEDLNVESVLLDDLRDFADGRDEARSPRPTGVAAASPRRDDLRCVGVGWGAASTARRGCVWRPLAVATGDSPPSRRPERSSQPGSVRTHQNESGVAPAASGVARRGGHSPQRALSDSTVRRTGTLLR